jgi:HPt (histidine-containing phosphotransfer) domain-containing protein
MNISRLPSDPALFDTRFDPAVLARLIESEDPATLADLYGTFLQSCEKSLGLLLQSLREADVTAASQHAHRLKSASAQVGALALSRMCAVIESDAQRVAVAVFDDWRNRLEEEAAAALDWIRARVTELSACIGSGEFDTSLGKEEGRHG